MPCLCDCMNADDSSKSVIYILSSKSPVIWNVRGERFQDLQAEIWVHLIRCLIDTGWLITCNSRYFILFLTVCLCVRLMCGCCNPAFGSQITVSVIVVAVVHSKTNACSGCFYCMTFRLWFRLSVIQFFVSLRWFLNGNIEFLNVYC